MVSERPSYLQQKEVLQLLLSIFKCHAGLAATSAQGMSIIRLAKACKGSCHSLHPVGNIAGTLAGATCTCYLLNLLNFRASALPSSVVSAHTEIYMPDDSVLLTIPEMFEWDNAEQSTKRLKLHHQICQDAMLRILLYILCLHSIILHNTSRSQTDDRAALTNCCTKT